MIVRWAESQLRERLADYSAVALLGPRQVGKTTLARTVAESWPQSVYLDLERPADLRRLSDADAYLRAQSGHLVVIDEVHRAPGLFEVLRGVIDDNRRFGHKTGQFLLLGSASLDLTTLSAESLAGRLSYLDLAGINVDEAAHAGYEEADVWLRGGFPDSLTARSDAVSLRWRLDLIRSYLERDIPMFAPRLPAHTLRRLWTMVAHTSGGLLNASRLAAGLGVSSPTVDRYLDLLADLGLVRRVSPWHLNIGKRITKAPKVFVRDTGLLHALLEIESHHDLAGHPAVGSSFESLVVETLIDAVGDGYGAHHYRTSTGDGVDLVLVAGGRPRIAIEAKRSTSPTVSAGFHRACADLEVPHRYVVHPSTGEGPYPVGEGAVAIGLTELVRLLRDESAGR